MTIGELERLAGITDRAAFWLPYAGRADGFVAGRDELRRLAGLPPIHDMLSREAGMTEPKRKRSRK